ncbi:MAG: hypothetical protein HY431_02630 [Candidatus Levybacteria bacterium]|nr:hypothetical protein [Candidatus Levybacteria bacterium]
MRTVLQTMQKGQMLIEIMVAMAISALFLPALLTGIVATQEGSAQAELRFSATALLKEAEEAVRSVRDTGWTNVAIKQGVVTHPVVSGTNWALADGTETINGYTRKVEIDDVWRDASGKIVADGQGELDPSTLEVLATVSWSTPYASSVTSSNLITRVNGNTSDTQDEINSLTPTPTFTPTPTLTPTPTFTPTPTLTPTPTTTPTPSPTNTPTPTPTRTPTPTPTPTPTLTPTPTPSSTTTTDDGNVTLAKIYDQDWCLPSVTASIDIAGLGIGRTIQAVPGRILTGTTGDASITLDSISISDTNPPYSLGESYWNSYNTNEVFGLPTDTYAYVATPNNDKPVVKVQINSSPWAEVAYFDNNPSGTGDGKSIYVVGGIGYVTVEGKLWNFNTTPNSNNRMLAIDTDGVDLYGTNSTGSRIWVVGNYAFVAANDAVDKAFQVFNVSSPSNLTRTQVLNVNNRYAKDLFVNASGTRAYMVTSDKNGKDPDGDGNGQLYIINTSTLPNPPVLLGNVTTSGMRPRGVVKVSNNRVIVVGKYSAASSEYQVFDVSTESSPTLCKGIDFGVDLTAVAAVEETDGDKYAYVMSKDTTAELKIIKGGIGGQWHYASSGTYESKIFDLFTNVTVNTISWTSTVPVGTSLKFKVAVAKAEGGSCFGANYVYVGPVKTDPNSYFTTTPSAVPLDADGSGYENPGRCFRYKAFLATTDPSQTPTLHSFSFNYSP